MLERWDPEKHGAMVERWCRSRGLPFERELLPPTGFVANGVIAAWLYLSDGGVAFADNLVDDPGASAFRLLSGLRELVPAMMAEAKACGMRGVVAMPCRPALSRALERLGLQPMVTGAAYFAARVV